MRKFLQRCAPFVVACAMAACGGDGDTTTGGATAPSPVSSSTPSPSPSPSPSPAPPSSQPACSATLIDLPATLPARGGTFTLSLLANADCAWTAAAQAEGWADITPRSGRGSATPTLLLSENVRPDPRTLVVTINSQSYRAIQNGITCIYTLSAAGLEIGQDAAGLELGVTTQPECQWTATSSESWITVGTPSGAGSRTIILGIARNTGDARQAFVTVANQRVAVTQRRGN